MDCRTGMMAVAALVASVLSTNVCLADWNLASKKRPCPCPCEPNPCQSAPYSVQPGESTSPMEQDSSPSDMMQPSPEFPELPSSATSFASATSLASATEGLGFRDATIGDFFGNTAKISGASYGITGQNQGFNIPIAGGDRRYKLTENVSPIPVDRWFVNYNHFSQPVQNIDLSGVDVDRVTLGIEKTFLDKSSSIELRLPILSGLDATQNTTGTGSQTGGEFGNLSLTLKSILWQRSDQTALTAGLAINLPTADDANAIDGNTSRTLVRINNQSVHLLPFVALYHQHSSRTWSIASAQLDFDVNGDTFSTESTPGSGEFTYLSRFQQQNFLYLDYTAGHWFYVDPCGCGLIRRAGILGELHYSTTINDTDIAAAGPDDSDIVRNPFNRLDVLNATGGLRFQLGDNYLFTAAVVAPLKDGPNKFFDSELAFLLTRRF